jgi:hypothetical protein
VETWKLPSDQNFVVQISLTRPTGLLSHILHKAPSYSFFLISGLFPNPEGFRSIENKKISYDDEQEQPRSDLRDAKQRAREIRSTYPCRLHSRNV